MILSLLVVIVLVLSSTAQVAPTSNVISTHFRSGLYQVSIPSPSPASWPYGSPTYTYSISFTSALSAVPQLMVTFSVLTETVASTGSIRLAASYPTPSTASSAFFSVSTTTGNNLNKLSIRYLAYLSFLLTPSFYIGKLEIENIGIDPTSTVANPLSVNQGLSNADQMSEAIFIHGVTATATSGNTFMLKPAISRNSTAITFLNLTNTLQNGIWIDFFGVTVILSKDSNLLSMANVPWLQTTVVNTSGTSAISFFGNATTWFDYTNNFIFILGIQYFKYSFSYGVWTFDISNTNNKLAIVNPFFIEQGISGFALPSKFCPTTNPYYLASNDTCYSACPPGYATDSTIFICIVCAAGTYPLGSSCLACPTGCATCTTPSTCQTCLIYYYLNSTSLCIKPTYLLISSPATATLVSPSGRHTVVETGQENNRPNHFGSGAQFICINGTNNWPGGYQAVYYSPFTITNCSNLEAFVLIAADDMFNPSTINGQTFGSGYGWGNDYYFKINLNCGFNNFTAVNVNGASYGIMHIIFTIGQCSSDAFINAASKCEGCPIGCPTCTSAANCLTCATSYYFRADHLCYTSCLASTYPNSTTQTCEACPTGCATCTSLTACQSCISAYYLNTTDSSCIPCLVGCAACYDYTNCSSCSPSYYFFSERGSCNLTCPQTTFANTTSMLCPACIPNCLTCIDSTTCQVCSGVSFLNASGLCEANSALLVSLPSTVTVTSPAGHYPVLKGWKSPLDNEAQWIQIDGGYLWSEGFEATFSSVFTYSACTHSEAILTVIADDSFVSQLNGASSGSGAVTYKTFSFKVNVVCGENVFSIVVRNNGISFGLFQFQTGVGIIFSITQCKTSQFVNALIQCQTCPLGCTTCASLTECRTCLIGFFLTSASLCQACPTGCAVCSSISSCSVCLSGYFLQADALCYNGCLQRFYASSSKCIACPYDCLTCTLSRQCSSCLASDNRELNTITGRCLPKGGYFESYSQVASACPNACLLCSSSTRCSVCQLGYVLSADSLCLSTCPQRFFANPELLTCEACPYDCLTCSVSGQCLSCSQFVDFRLLSNSTARCVPLTGYFDNKASIAVKCPEGCYSCTSLVLCISCLTGFFKGEDSLCRSSCAPRYFANPQTLLCQLCPYDCLTCDANGNCLTCDASVDFRQLNTVNKRCSPLAGYYESQTQVCNRCPASCGNCSSSTHCSSCLQGFVLREDHKCYNSCPDRFILNIESTTCEPCPYDCLTCDSRGYCLSCDPSDFRSLSNITLRCNPYPGYYDNEVALAVVCPLGCELCQSALLCSRCVVGHFLINNLCSSSCPERYYSNSQSRVCQACPYDCLTCGANGNCLSCTLDDYRILIPSTKRCLPMIGYYEVTSVIRLLQPQSNLYTASTSSLKARLLFRGWEKRCVKCPANCVKCFSSNECSECSEGYFMRQDSFCYTDCLPRFYASSILKACIPCHYDCYSCSYNHKCTSCNATTDFRELNKHNSRCIPSLGYYQSFDTVASQCPNGCLSCTQRARCTACKDGFLMTKNDLCSNSCPEREYMDTIGKACRSCPFDCLSCQASGECITCSAADFRVLGESRRCQPMKGYFQNKAQVCLSCPQGCKTCYNSSTCSSCQSGYFFLNSLCLAACPDRYYGNLETARCTACPNDCLTCDKEGKCLTCHSGDYRRLFDYNNRCLPLAGRYENFTRVPPECPYRCTMCLNSKVCTACRPGYYLSLLSTCESVCQPRFKLDLVSMTCTRCPYDCRNCDDDGICLSCNAEDHRTMDQKTKRCVPLPGYYEMRTWTCPACPVPCATCQSLQVCLTCKPGFFFTSNFCYLSCPIRQFGQAGTNTCESCPYDCLSCNDTGACLTCAATDYRVLDTATKRCIPMNGHYEDKSQVTPRCPSSCLRCHSPDFCFQCSTGFFLSDENRCVTSCPTRYYRPDYAKRCHKCPFDCLTCDHLGNCLSCSGSGGDFRELQTGSKRCDPLPGYFHNETIIAPPCPTFCSVCVSSTVCSQCVAGFLLSPAKMCVGSCPERFYQDVLTSSCIACPYDCLSCSSAGSCLTCNSSDFRVLDTITGRCLPQPGYFDSKASACARCPEGCSVCRSLTFCSACVPGFYLRDDDMCYSSCPYRYFQDQTTGICQACPFDCYACDVSGKCSECGLTSDFRVLTNGTLRCLPRIGYFENKTSVCPQCPLGCFACISLANCLSCQPGSYLLPDKTCSGNCPARFFKSDFTLTCRPCPFDCLTCTSKGLCLTCSASDFRMFSPNTSRCVAATGYYDSNLQVCSKCPAGCAACESLTLCEYCEAGYFLRKDSLCYATCLERYFGDTSTHTCQKCPYDCLQCNSEGKCSDCSLTADYRVLTSGTLRCIPTNKFFENFLSICSQCPVKCALCVSPDFCMTCQVGSVLTFEKQCASACPPRTYVSTLTRSCQVCPYDCLTCTDKGLCLTCDPSDNRQLFNDSRRCIAKVGFFDNFTQVCVGCPSTCFACNSLTLCLSCKPGHFLNADNSCSSGCPLRLFGDPSSLVCLTCPYDCLTCSSTGLCSSCSSSTDFRELSTTANSTRCLPLKGYYDVLTAVSALCLPGCLVCLSAEKCLLCSYGYTISVGVCFNTCPDRQYRSTDTKLCTACPYDCMFCKQTGECTSCNATTDFRTLNASSARCQPLQGYFESGVTISTRCPSGCGTCSNSSFCLSCAAGFYMQSDNNCYTSCPVRKYPNEVTRACANCPYDCYTCDSLGNCLICNSASDFRGLSSGRCLPLTGYFEGNLTVASKCPVGCYSCSSASVCGVCSSNYYFIVGDQICHAFCPARFYPDDSSQRCSACPYDCYGCLRSGVCTSCNSTTDFRQLDSSTYRCLPLQGYFDAKVTVAVRCPSSCRACSNATFCTSCASGFFFRADSLCYTSCQERYYADNLTQRCTACFYDCYTCNNNSACLACNASTDFRELNLSTARCQPLVGYFDSGATVAEKCLVQCSACSSLANCSACASGFFLTSDNRCTDYCLLGYYADSPTRRCVLCPPGCLSCSNLSFCSACSSGYFLRTDRLCYTDCSPRFFGNIDTLLCTLCPYDCFTCDAKRACLTCNATSDFRGLASGRCVPLQGYYEGGVTVSLQCTLGCKSCSSNSTCLSCSSGFFFQADQLCHATCPLRMFPNTTSSRCEACPYDCLLCDSTGACLNCSLAVDFRVLEGGRCVASPGYYDNGTTVSAKCSLSCAACASPTNCSICSSGFYLRTDSMCYDSCPARYYPETLTRTCKPCAYDCYTCQDPSSCLSCNATADFRVLNSVTKRCDPVVGYYENFSTICPQCSSVCSACSSPTVCSACSPGYYLNSRNYCENACPNGYYINNQTWDCTPCPLNCTVCSSPTFCSACASGYFLTLQHLCLTNCIDKYFRDNSSNVCTPCLYDCATCTNGSSCLSCNATTDFRQLDNATLRCRPIKGYYDPNATVCLLCPSNCTACTSVTTCTECDYRHYLGRDGASCLYKCLTPLLAKDQERPTCPNCPYDCLTCDPYGDCLTCNPSENRELNELKTRCRAILGYYDDRSFVAKPCSSNCQSCHTALDCLVCDSGYEYSYTTLKCEALPDNSLSTPVKALIYSAGAVAVIGLLVLGYILYKKMAAAAAHEAWLKRVTHVPGRLPGSVMVDWSNPVSVEQIVNGGRQQQI